MTRHRPPQRRPRTKGRKARTLRVRAALHTPPDLRVLAEALIDLAYDTASEADTNSESAENDTVIGPLDPPSSS
ncbi:MAG: hypothetical protein ACRD2C_18515 [Acidimicrobiales bacterium]